MKKFGVTHLQSILKCSGSIEVDSSLGVKNLKSLAICLEDYASLTIENAGKLSVVSIQSIAKTKKVKTARVIFRG